MPSRPVGVADTANADAVAEIDVVERASPDLTTTTTADPGAGGTTLAVTSASKFPASGNYKIRVEAEVMRVTAGQGTTSWTVARGIDGTSAVAHTTGVLVAQVVGVQRVEPVDGSRQVTYIGRANSFRIPGRAGTAGQKLVSLHNATASPIKVRVRQVTVDFTATVVKAVTVLPPAIRLWKVTVLPTGGSAMVKTPIDSALASSSSLTLLQDAQADGSSSATALTVTTLPAQTILASTFAPRLITAAGYEMFDRTQFLEGEGEFVTLNALEGIVVFLDYVLVTQNPITDMWLCSFEWGEYTNA